MTVNHFRSHFSPFQINTQLFILWKCWMKWPPAAILDDRTSHSVAFIDISDQYSTFIFWNLFYKMAAGAQFGWPKITFDRISRPFRSIRNFLFWICFQNGRQRPFWIFSFFASYFIFFRLSPKSIGFFHSGHQWLRQIWIWYPHWCRRYDCGVQTETIISQKFQISGI